MASSKHIDLPLDTIIEVLAEKEGKIYKRDMTIKEANLQEKKEGFLYRRYQLGFSSFKNVINVKK